MGGRPPSAAGIKIMHGRGDGKDSAGREVKQAAVFAPECPDPPAWLPPYAAQEWDRVGPVLAERHLLKAADRAALTAYCLAWDRIVRSYEVEYLEYDADAKRRVDIERESASKELRAWAREFGLTPVAGIKLIPPTPDKPVDDPFA